MFEWTMDLKISLISWINLWWYSSSSLTPKFPTKDPLTKNLNPYEPCENFQPTQSSFYLCFWPNLTSNFLIFFSFSIQSNAAFLFFVKFWFTNLFLLIENSSLILLRTIFLTFCQYPFQFEFQYMCFMNQKIWWSISSIFVNFLFADMLQNIGTCNCFSIILLWISSANSILFSIQWLLLTILTEISSD